MTTPLELTFQRLRFTWLIGTIALSLFGFAAAIALAPPASAEAGPALTSLLFLGSSMHVAATAWFYTLPEVRAHAVRLKGRYVIAPVALIVGTALAAMVLPESWLLWALYAYFAWQFFHFQKQNLGMAALASAAQGSGSLNRFERQGIVVAGIGGIAGLLTRPVLLDLKDANLAPLLPLAELVFVAGVVLGLYGLWQRTRRPRAFMIVYGISLLFFVPVFVFSSPYAAVAGLTVAHGYQYLLIVGLMAGAPRRGPSGLLGLGLMLCIAVMGGLALNLASHMHGSPIALERALYGAYLGVVMAHFVIDAGLWRLREEFPRRLLTASVPYLLKP